MLFAEKSLFAHKGKSKEKTWMGVKSADVVKDIQRDGKAFCAAPKEVFVPVAELKPKKEIAEIPGWVQYACFLAIGLGTLSGGWRIIKTMGTKITKVTPLEGVAAESAGAIEPAGAAFAIKQGGQAGRRLPSRISNPHQCVENALDFTSRTAQLHVCCGQRFVLANRTGSLKG